MRSLERLSEYLGSVERRLRLLTLTRGVAASAAAALVLTVVAVLAANQFAFSGPSIVGARIFLFFGVALALAAALIVPVIRLNQRRAARAAERRYPQFEERLLTFTERVQENASDPFLPLLAADALSVAERGQAKEVARTAWIFSFSSAALVSAVVLFWLAAAGPGFLGYGTSLLWGGIPKGDVRPYYAVLVEPGNRTIRKGADQLITARLQGFTTPRVRFFAKYASSSKWEEAEMRTEPGGAAYQFLIAGVPESLEYYVEAGGMRSQAYKISVADLPSIRNIKVTYHFPAWTGLKDAAENPGGDLRAVEGTTAEVAIQTDKPLANGAILLDDGTELKLRPDAGGLLAAAVPIQKDGLYHFAAIESGEHVRLSEDYFIEAQKYQPPEVSVTRPGRDFRASPIEEVTVAVEARDDFGLKGVALHYSVNGGPEKTVSMLQAGGAKNSSGSAVIALEDYKVQPGDVVSLYATANGARANASTDIFFIQAEPFERNYSQSQDTGGGGGGGGDPSGEISQRQKEIITATWNQLKGAGREGGQDNAAFLSSVQSKLRDQAKSLSARMKSRQLQGAGDSFKTFVENMDMAVEAMSPAADKLKGAKWQEALVPEQKALQYLLRAESTFRDIQVAFGSRGGGGGGGMSGATRDLQGLFDLELDTEKNQYESNRMTQAAGPQQRQLDEALEKLRQLARRQQELAEQQRRGPQTPQQRWEQEMLRREAEQLQRQMEQLARSQSGQLSRNGQQEGQQGQQSQQGQQAGQSGELQQGRPGQMGQPGVRGSDPRQLRQTLDRLQQALQNMRQAASSQSAGTPQSEADAHRAAERLNEAEQMLSALRGNQSAGQVDNLARQADDLARRQQDFESQLRRAYIGENHGGLTREQGEQLAGQRQDEIRQLKQLEQGMQNAVRDLMTTQRGASTKLREALGEMQQQEFSRDMQRNAEWIRRGMGEYAVISEFGITQGLNNLRDQLRGVQQALGDSRKNDAKGGQDQQAVERALSQVEKLRRQMEQMQSGARGRGQGAREQQQLSRNGQQGGQQQGQQQGGQQQGGGETGGGPSGGSPQAGGMWNPNRNGLGDPRETGSGPVRPQDFQATYRDAIQSLMQLQQQSRNDPATARDVQSLLNRLREVNPFAYSNDTLLNDRIHAALLSGVEQVEMELRRKLEAADGGSSRSPAAEPVPPGYADAVAEYFRRLSKGK